MSERSKVIWSMGMFMLPQHFQQQDRYFENMVNNRCQGQNPCFWGFYTIKIDRDLLTIGKLSLTECRGVFTDGTAFNLPVDDQLPMPIDIPQDAIDETVYLALPLRRSHAVETDSDNCPESLARFRMAKKEVKNTNSGEEVCSTLHIGKLNTRLMLQREELSGYTVLGVARVVEARDDKNVILDDHYIPANLNCSAIPKLKGLLQELHGLLNSRGEALADRVAKSGHGAVAEIADFMLLQMINRYQPLLGHLSSIIGLHPEIFFRHAVQLAGELSTFFSEKKRPAAFTHYNHDDLQSTFSPLMKELRQLFGKVYQPTAIQIPLSNPKFGVYAAKIPDVNLLDGAMFVLAANAQVPPEQLRNHFPKQITLAPVEKIQEYVNSLTTGVSIHPLQIVPRQIPYHAGFTYFELYRHKGIWQELKSSAGFAIHIGGHFPGLVLEFWAIRKD